MALPTDTTYIQALVERKVALAYPYGGTVTRRWSHMIEQGRQRVEQAKRRHEAAARIDAAIETVLTGKSHGKRSAEDYRGGKSFAPQREAMHKLPKLANVSSVNVVELLDSYKGIVGNHDYSHYGEWWTANSDSYMGKLTATDFKALAHGCQKIEQQLQRDGVPADTVDTVMELVVAQLGMVCGVSNKAFNSFVFYELARKFKQKDEDNGKDQGKA